MKPISQNMKAVVAAVRKLGTADYVAVQQEVPGMSHSGVATYMQRARHHGYISFTGLVERRNQYRVTPAGEEMIGVAAAAGQIETHGVGPFPFKPVQIPRINSVWALGT